MTTIMKHKPQTTTNFLNLFDDLLDDKFLNLNSGINTGIPHYDIIENDNDYNINFMLAGFNRDDISINVEKNILFIKGERKTNNDVKYSHKGSFYGEFKKSFTLPEDALSDKITASFENGVLSLKIPKDEKTKLSKTIEIK